MERAESAAPAAEENATTSANSPVSSSFESVIQRLVKRGVGANFLEKGPVGLLEFVREDLSRVSEAIAALFPDVDDLKESEIPQDDRLVNATREDFPSSLHDEIFWAKWLLFGCDPKLALAETGLVNCGARGICGAVWGTNDIAYRCRTCENDPTCAICVPCFQAGDHMNHDYSMIRTGGGCCDCGDVTAWKESGFCCHHRGPGHVPSLPREFVVSAAPVLEALLTFWVSKLCAAQTVSEGRPKKWSAQKPQESVACQVSIAVISMLLEFCSSGESMLSFTAKYVARKNLGVLDTLLETESLLPKQVVELLHELLYKLLGDANFKYAFAQAFIAHYPKFMCDSVQEELTNPSSSNSSSKFRDQAILGNFSVQIFTVPTLTPKLVLESQLLDMLVATLKELFLACAGDDGRIMVSKGPILSKLYIRVMEDIRYVMTHAEVAQYVAGKRPDLCKVWLELLAFVQGMHAQHRVINIHVEEENEDWESAYCLEAQMSTIHPLYVLGAAAAANANSVVVEACRDFPNMEQECVDNDDDNFVRHAKLGRISPKDTNDCDMASASATDVEMADVARVSTGGGETSESIEFKSGGRHRNGKGVLQGTAATASQPLVWLISECTTMLDRWLGLDSSRELAKCSHPTNADVGLGSVQQRGSPSRSRARGVTRGVTRMATVADPAAAAAGPPQIPDAEVAPGRGFREWLRRSRRPYAAIITSVDDRGHRRATENMASSSESVEMDVDGTGIAEAVRSRGSCRTEWWMCTDDTSAGAGVGRCFGDDWPEIDFDVSRQDVSFHIPLHRMLALLLHKSLEYHPLNAETTYNSNDKQGSFHGSLDKTTSLWELLPEKYQVSGFSAYLMEHPLRLQVLCAQVQAGMWRRNGHTTSTMCELYRTVPWCEDSLELDLLMLQCCAAMAPPEKFIDRILSRFGLSDYFTLSLWRPNEYEPSLAQEFLVLLIRICTERSFCGLSQTESMRRELVHRLAVGDATHSSLVKALPRRLQDSKHLQECLNAVARYQNPSGMQQGKYVLRKECWSEMDLYHPRWSPRELQFAEERYVRACKASPVFLQLPRWKKPLPALSDMGRFIISEKAHNILHSIFFHAAFSNNMSDSRATEGLLFTALHLLALGLDVCSQSPYGHEKDSNRHAIVYSEEGVGMRLPDSEDLHPSTFRISSPKPSEEPPLLAQSLKRLYVSGTADAGITERHSLLSLLVLLLRKYSSGEGIMGTAVETSQYGAGDLIKSLLRKFAALHHGCMYEIESLAPEIFHRPSVASNPSADNNAGADEVHEKQAVTDAEKRKIMARERQKAAMEKMKAAQDRFVASLQHESNEPERWPKEWAEAGEGTSEEHSEIACALCHDSASSSPLCFLTLVQKSRLIALAQKPTPSWERVSATLVGERGSDAPRSMTEGVNHEMYTTADLWNWIQDALGDAATRERLLDGEALLEVFRNGLHPGIRNAVRLANAVGTPPLRDVEPVQSEVDELEANGEGNEIETCQEVAPVDASNWWEQDPGSKSAEEWSSRLVGLATVLAEYVAAVSRGGRRQGERELPRPVDVEVGNEGGAIRGRRIPGRNNMDATVHTGLGLNDMSGVYLSACGHAVHQECLDRYFSSLLQRYYSRALFEGVQIVDPDMGEFLCPVCRRLANSIVPALPVTNIPHAQSEGTSSSGPMNILSHGLGSRIAENEFLLQKAFLLLMNAENIVGRAGFRKTVNSQLPDSMKGALETLAIRLHGLYHPDKDNLTAHGRVPQVLHLWDVFRYSLMSSELAARTYDTSHTQGLLGGLLMLEEASDGSKGSVLPLLLHAAKASQAQSRQVVLLRSRGMQLLVDSIVHGVTRDLFSEKVLPGDFSSLLHYLEKGQDSADVQFWKRMADPVLLHDPFSSLVWLVFCLPLQLPSGGVLFTSLVHLYYLVCLTQAVAYAGVALKSEGEGDEPASAFVSAVQGALNGTLLATSDGGQVSLSGASTLSVIRQLTLPYLRQCFLLEALISGSGHLLPVARAHLWELSQSGSTAVRQPTGLADDGLCHKKDETLRELEEVEQLEKYFSIAPLTDLLKDDSIQSTVLKWCQHAQVETGASSIRYVPRPVRGTRFKLMQLPHLFQDLLQRYVKERCPACNKVPAKPALCLLCGALCCASTKPPSCISRNNRGDCYSHAMACGAGIGVFLMLRRTTVLLQRCERQAMWPSPYLDAYGEEDVEHRGKPLFLSEERYAALTAMVVSHGLDYSSLVLAQTTRLSLV